MTPGCDTALARGLRTLELLARDAPLDLTDFAARNGLTLDDAAALLAAFERSGYVRRLSQGSHYVLTRLALRIFCSDELVPGAIEQPGRLH